MLKNFNILLPEVYNTLSLPRKRILRWQLKYMVCVFPLVMRQPCQSILGLGICSSYSQQNHTRKWTLSTHGQDPGLWHYLVITGRSKLALCRLTCSPCCRLRVIALSALTIWALVAAGLSRFSRPMPSSSFKRYGTKSAFRA